MLDIPALIHAIRRPGVPDTKKPPPEGRG
jgi:hypothetical protein